MSRVRFRSGCRQDAAGRIPHRVLHPYGSVPGTALSVLIIVSVIAGVTTFLPSTGVGTPDTWTFMVYMAADNDLESWAIEDFLELSSVGSSSDVNIVVQLDRSLGYDTSYGGWATCKRFLVTQGMTPTASNASMDIGEVNMGNSATLTEFMNWTVNNFVTTHYVLVIWDHGNNWGGVAYDYYMVYSYLDMGELDTALAGAEALNPGLMLDVIAFDACSMGSLEVAYQVMPYARYMIASEMDIPNPGFEYSGPMSALVANPNMGVTEFGDEILGHYSEYYMSLAGTLRWEFLNGSFALSMVDLQLVGQLASSVDRLSAELTSGMDYWVNHVKAARNATESYYGVTANDSADLHHLAENLASIVPNATIDLLASDVISGVDSAVLNETHGTNPLNSTVPVNHTNGLSIYFQPQEGSYSPSYSSSSLAYVNATSWDEFLALYDTQWRLGYPTVMMYAPTGIDVPQMTSLEVWFSEPVDVNSFLDSLEVNPTPGGLPSFVYTNGSYISYSPGTFAPGTTYTVTITTNITDFDGLHMQRNFTWQFTMAPEEIPEFPDAVLPALILLAFVLVAASRRGPGKAIRK